MHQQDIVPCYRLLFPEHPSFMNYETGKIEHLLAPYYGPTVNSFQDYLSWIKNTNTGSRRMHGVLHGTRTALWTLLYVALYQKATLTKMEYPHLLALAGAAHDIAREDEGEDLWNTASAEWFKDYLKSQNVQNECVYELFHAINEKDPKNGIFVAAEQEAIHDADALEICREIPDSEFRKEHLCFYHFPTFSLELKDAIIREVQHFIFLTENSFIKRFIECSSENCFYDLVLFLNAFHVQSQTFPHLTGLLNPLLGFE